MKTTLLGLLFIFSTNLHANCKYFVNQNIDGERVVAIINVLNEKGFVEVSDQSQANFSVLEAKRTTDRPFYKRIGLKTIVTLDVQNHLKNNRIETFLGDNMSLGGYDTPVEASVEAADRISENICR